MIPLLIPKSQRQNVPLHQILPQLTSHFQVREIDDSPTTAGDLVFPSFGVACFFVMNAGNLDGTVVRVRSTLQRRRHCLILASQELMWDAQLRLATEFDIAWGCVLGFNGSDELAEVILGFIRGFTSE